MSEASLTGRDAVMFLDDNVEVLDATSAYFESRGVQVVRAVTPAEAWKLLETWNESVRCAYIDKTLQRDQSGGIEFVERARERYPNVDFSVITAWPLTGEERRRVDERRIDLLEKARSRPSDLYARYQTQPSDLVEVVELSADESEESSEVASADVIFQARLQEEVLAEKERRFNLRIGRMARDLIRRLRRDEQFGNEPIYLGSSQYSIDELIQEICDGTALGLALLDAHFAELDDLARRFDGVK